MILCGAEIQNKIPTQQKREKGVGLSKKLSLTMANAPREARPSTRRSRGRKRLLICIIILILACLLPYLSTEQRTPAPSRDLRSSSGRGRRTFNFSDTLRSFRRESQPSSGERSHRSKMVSIGIFEMLICVVFVFLLYHCCAKKVREAHSARESQAGDQPTREQ